MLFDILQLMNRDFTPARSKIHLATWNGKENPLDVYLAGEFDEWQRWQSKRSFERDFVVSLIKLPGKDTWLFAGVHHSVMDVEERNARCRWYYNLAEHESARDLNGRIIAGFARTGRQARLDADRWANQIAVIEVKAERLTIGEFPGFKSILLSKGELDLIVEQSIESWRSALSSVAGIYLITDTETGKHYVGSACGEGGIWERWCAYASSGHGGNVELKRILCENSAERVSKLRFSVLEIADVHASKEEIIRRECHWKDVLSSRLHGLNAN